MPSHLTCKYRTLYSGLGKCTQDTCANRGTCHLTSDTCNCDLTSFTGPLCTDGNGPKSRNVEIDVDRCLTYPRTVYVIQCFFISNLLNYLQLVSIPPGLSGHINLSLILAANYKSMIHIKLVLLFYFMLPPLLSLSDQTFNHFC